MFRALPVEAQAEKNSNILSPIFVFGATFGTEKNMPKEGDQLSNFKFYRSPGKNG